MLAVKGVSFEAHPGQVTGFLGPNGAGKTTTMRMLTGYMPPTSGSAKVAGYDVFDQSLQVRQHVGYLPENVPLYRDMTTRGYLQYVGEIRGVRKLRVRTDEVLERVGLANRANSRIRTLSKGMKQRVGLAQALLHNPDVLILDEPTIGLDPYQVLELRSLVRDLGRDHTLLFSTHILSEAEQVCDNVVIINQGEIIAKGSPAELRAELARGGRIVVRVEGDAQAAASVVRDVPGVADASVDALLGGAIVITPSSTNLDPRPAVASAIVAHQIKLTEMRLLAVNLEEIFLELTRQEAANEITAAESAPNEVAAEA
ncbi:MAG: ABC transporter ATP-binding protein [Anaerolineae bacterium]